MLCLIFMQKSDSRYLIESNEETGQCTLTIRKCVLEDKGIYSCEILEFVKKDKESFCDCIVDIEGIGFLLFHYFCKNRYMI